jgi:hypothetical protein
MNKSDSSKKADSSPDSREQKEVPEELRLAFDALAQIVGLDAAEKRIGELRKVPKGATLDPQKSRERLEVARGLERGLTLGEAIREVTQEKSEFDPRYNALYVAFTRGGAEPYWRAVARAEKAANHFRCSVDPTGTTFAIGIMTGDIEK